MNRRENGEIFLGQDSRLKSIVERQAQWVEDDLERLGLLK